MNIFFLSLGCDKNLSDSEHMLKLLSDAGYSFTEAEEEADIVIVNTCCFIGDAKEESIREILRLASYKENGRLKALITTGCLSERYQKELEAELPEIDGALGISAWDRIVYVVQEALEGRKPHVYTDKNRLCTTDQRILTTGGHYAYLKIAEGCDKFCTYCIIPKIRGRYRSVPMEELLKEAEMLVDGGVKELILVAQETTLYGTDLYGKKMLPELLRKLSEITELRWIRLLYCYPEEITDELIAEIRDNDKVVKYLDIPIQHASDAVLKRMNRRTNRAEITERIRKMRTEIPDLALRTTFITGFPGESENDHKEMLEFVKEIRFERLGVFTYSQEEDTAAASMTGQVPERIKARRKDRIMRAQQKIVFERAEGLIGRTVDVMIEGRVTAEEALYVGRTYMDAPDVDGYIFLHSTHDFMSGDFVKAVITQAKDYDLIGEICDESAEQYD